MLHIVSTNNKNEQIVDARPPNQFNGKFFLYHFFSNQKIILGSNAGHLPNSLNVPYTEVFDQTNQGLKSNDELKKRNDFIK